MKRILCTLLTIAMLLSVPVCTFATEISEIEVTVTLPKCGDTISPGAIQINATSPTGLNCSGLFVFTGEAVIAEGKTITTDLVDFSAFAATNSLSDTQTYAQQNYLLVLMISGQNTAFNSETTLSADGCISANSMFDFYDENNGNEVLYCYIEFTPTEADSGTDSGDDDDSGSDPGTGGSTGSSTNENATDVGGSKDVTVKYDDSNAANIIYSVNITWGSLEFKYQPLQGQWDPETHLYKNMVAPGWSFDPGANEITVTNHSNSAITATFSYSPESSFNTISGNFYSSQNYSENDKITQAPLATAVGTAPDNAPTYTAYLQLFGTLDKEKTASVTSGTVTVTIE